jgi:hypothetical protein
MKKNEKSLEVLKETPFNLAKQPHEFSFIQKMPLGAHEYRLDAGKGFFSRNQNKLKNDVLLMHVFYISPILEADTFFLFNENQEKRTQWVEVGFFNEHGEMGTIMLYDNAIKNLYNTIKELPKNVLCSQDDNGGIYLFCTLEFGMTEKEKQLTESKANYYVPNFKYLGEHPEALKSDLEMLYNGENDATVFAIMASYRIMTVPRFDRATKQRVN